MKGEFTSASFCVSNNELNRLDKRTEAALMIDFSNVLTAANINANYDLKEMFNSQESITWRLNVKFVPLNTVTKESKRQKNATDTSEKNKETYCGQQSEVRTPIAKNQDLSENERLYLDEIQFCLEDDNEIDEKERRMLERIRIKYDIDKSRAEELERTLIQGTAEEEEFRTAVREYLEDGELTEKDNALLARLANRLGITPERADELKKQIADE